MSSKATLSIMLSNGYFKLATSMQYISLVYIKYCTSAEIITRLMQCIREVLDGMIERLALKMF